MNDIADQAMRRAMVAWGLDPTDETQRAVFANTTTGAFIRLNAYWDLLFRNLTEPLVRLLDRISRGR